VYIFFISTYLHVSVNIIFTIHYALIGKYVFVIFLNSWHENIRSTCSSLEMLKEYMASENLGTTGLD